MSKTPDITVCNSFYFFSLSIRYFSAASAAAEAAIYLFGSMPYSIQIYILKVPLKTLFATPTT